MIDMNLELSEDFADKIEQGGVYLVTKDDFQKIMALVDEKDLREEFRALGVMLHPVIAD